MRREGGDCACRWGRGRRPQGYPFLRPVILQPHSKPRVLTLTSGPAPIFPPLLAGERAQPGGKVRLRPRGAGSPVRDSDARAPQSRDSHDACVTLGEEWARTLRRRCRRGGGFPEPRDSPLRRPSSMLFPPPFALPLRWRTLGAVPGALSISTVSHFEAVCTPPPRPLRGASEVTR